MVSEAVGEFGSEAVWAGLVTRGGAGPLERRAQLVDPSGLEASAREGSQRFVIPGDE